jgi:hypothetical protein
MSYFLNTSAMRVVDRNERGNVTYRKRYRKGDEVDVSHIDEARVKYLVEKGTLVQSEDDLSAAQDAGDATPHSGPYGAETSDAPSTLDAPREDGEQESTEGEGEGEGEEEVEDVDEYSEMDYATLQQEAKSRDLNAGGSAEDLRARLREDDAS